MPDLTFFLPSMKKVCLRVSNKPVTVNSASHRDLNTDFSHKSSS